MIQERVYLFRWSIREVMIQEGGSLVLMEYERSNDTGGGSLVSVEYKRSNAHDVV